MAALTSNSSPPSQGNREESNLLPFEQAAIFHSSMISWRVGSLQLESSSSRDMGRLRRLLEEDLLEGSSYRVLGLLAERSILSSELFLLKLVDASN